ncbi:MAG: hypothetical protein IJ306_10780 [Oscillospiraceae bacterium]|nr:hypothetical protein [Oscillospiraceae bacterium]
MTVNECYEIAVSFLPEEPADNVEMQKFAVPWCNMLLAETFEQENVYRRTKGLAEIAAVPKVSAKTDEIPYNENMVRAAFPYGMARWIFRENDDVSGSHEYYNLYAAAVSASVPLLTAEVEDVYR